MNLNTRLIEINQALLNAQYDQAAEMLSGLVPTDLVERRMVAHYKAILMFHKGELREARTLMEQALSEYGENVNLVRDLMVCQFHLHDMLAFRTNLARLEQLLTEHEATLSARSLLECELMVGKFLEEEARLAPAILFYERALLRGFKPEHRIRALIQRARWKALYEPTAELSEMYRELISVPHEDVSQDLGVELQHSLMLIELRLVGSDHAWQRIERLGSDVCEMDRRLLVFDFVEGALAQDLNIDEQVYEVLNQFKELDPYEAFLKKYVQGPLEHTAKIHELTVLSSKLPWASYLRILCLVANQESNASAKQELNRKIQLITCGLDQKSQSLWNLRLKQALQSPEIRIEVSLRSRSLTLHGKCVDLSKKKIGLQLLEGLLTKNVMSVDEAITLLWGASFSPEHYHRLRMSIHRLNTLIHEITGLGKIIEVDSQMVRLRPEVRLKRSDENVEVSLLGI